MLQSNEKSLSVLYKILCQGLAQAESPERCQRSLVHKLVSGFLQVPDDKFISGVINLTKFMKRACVLQKI